MIEKPTQPHPSPLPCGRCGYLADGSAGPQRFCPKCGLDRRAGAAPAEPDPSSTVLIGQVVAERYRLVRLLGEGGMGAVFKAEHVRMGKALAVKLLRGSFARDPAAVERFRTEARLVSRLSHPHTIGVFDFGELRGGDGFYLAMEYVPGEDLARVLRREGRLDQPRAVTIAEQLLGSLAEAHDAGIVHRDVKPANVMLMATRDGDFVKVLDFGIATLRGAGGADGPGGTVIGTPGYLSPEQARGGPLDARSDLYAVGALLYELLSGRCPFVGRDPVQVMLGHLTEEPPPLRRLAPFASEGLAAAVHRALRKRPEERFASADEMRRALLRALGQPSHPSIRLATLPEPGAELASRSDFAELERPAGPLRRSRGTAPLTALAVLSLLGAALWRWPDLHAFLGRRLPAVAARVPGLLRPPDRFDGLEHEPNDDPALANPLPLPAGLDGRPGGGDAVIRGHLGTRRDDATGDVDLYRVEVPDLGRKVLLVAEWSGPRPGEGIPGLGVALTLNRDPGQGAQRTAPLVAQSDRGDPGRPARLSALVEPGCWYLAVREQHDAGTPPVEKPSDWYQLRVRLGAPRPCEEGEQSDVPEAVDGGARRYPAWRALALRNSLGEGTLLDAELRGDDADTFAVERRAAGEAPEVVALLPASGLGLSVELWTPDAGDLAPAGEGDRERFTEAGLGAAGEVLALRLAPPRAGAPVLVRVRAGQGEGRYQVLALGSGARSGTAVPALVEALAQEGRGALALELAAAVARALPGAPWRTELLLAAGRLAERLAAGARPAEAADHARASRLLGAAVFDVVDGRVVYGGAFEALVDGSGPLAEEALHRAATRVLPCTCDAVARRAEGFLLRFPRSRRAGAVRLRLARAREEEFWESGDRSALAVALGTYRQLARGGGPEADEARDRSQELSRPRPPRPATTRLRCE